MGDGNNATAISTNGTEPTKSSDNEQGKLEYYKSYDVMTGVRIAITLGGFFSLMVLLVVYKSKCKSRSISEENLEASVAAAVLEEEQMGARKAYGFYEHKTISAVTAPRFSSVGGGYSIYTPPTRFGYSLRGRVSLPTSSPYIYPSPYTTRIVGDSPPPKTPKAGFGIYENDSFPQAPHLLRVPLSRRSSRRLSSITCSSCDSSYLERRGSALEIGKPIGPPFTGDGSDRLEEEPWDYYYPIDIQVIQPTPEISPTESQVSVNKGVLGNKKSALCVPKATAPLASISSCRIASSFELDSHSIGSDSVFLDEELIDTEDEVEEFSTDSDADNVELHIPSKLPNDARLNELCSKELKHRVPSRRHSSPITTKLFSLPTTIESAEPKPSTSTTSSFVPTVKSARKTSSDSETLQLNTGLCRKYLSHSYSSIPRTSMSASCDHLAKALQLHTSPSDVNVRVIEHCSWSQETLF